MCHRFCWNSAFCPMDDEKLLTRSEMAKKVPSLVAGRGRAIANGRGEWRLSTQSGEKRRVSLAEQRSMLYQGLVDRIIGASPILLTDRIA